MLLTHAEYYPEGVLPANMHAAAHIHSLLLTVTSVHGHLLYSCEGSNVAMFQNQLYHFGIGALPILVYFSWDWDVDWGVLTHGHVFPP